MNLARGLIHQSFFNQKSKQVQKYLVFEPVRGLMQGILSFSLRRKSSLRHTLRACRICLGIRA
jgi:hypothetical protein